MPAQRQTSAGTRSVSAADLQQCLHNVKPVRGPGLYPRPKIKNLLKNPHLAGSHAGQLLLHVGQAWSRHCKLAQRQTSAGTRCSIQPRAGTTIAAHTHTHTYMRTHAHNNWSNTSCRPAYTSIVQPTVTRHCIDTVLSTACVCCCVYRHTNTITHCTWSCKLTKSHEWSSYSMSLLLCI